MNRARIAAQALFHIDSALDGIPRGSMTRATLIGCLESIERRSVHDGRIDVELLTQEMAVIRLRMNELAELLKPTDPEGVTL